jgi:phage gp29-like protein
MTGLVDQHGRPIRREVLTQEVAGPTVFGLRSPIAGYPADGLNPLRLAQILRAADAGDPLRYFELAELIEERDPHYVGVLGTRKRSVAQIDVSVIAASEDAHDVMLADMVREWLDRDELADETFDVLDAVGKGVSYTEIIWDTSEGQWRPARLEWRDPRWFEFNRADGRTPLLRGGESGAGQSIALEPFKFISHTVKAKSGLPVRSGLARIAAWGWMFKAFTQRDWAIFAQTYGQPVRIGKFDSNASAEDRRTLFRAVANIAGDMAAIVPKGMDIEFIESANVGAGSDLYERRADWLDRQISKAVLGQTGTTDSKSGGLGDGGNKVHNDVREDIETADCKALAATLNRDLVRPWIQLEHGPQPRYPRIKIERPKPEDLIQLAEALDKLVPLGLRVKAAEVRDKFALSEPGDGDELLQARAPAAPSSAIVTTPPLPGAPSSPERTALQAAEPVAPSPAEQIADRLAGETEPEMRAWLGELALMMQAAGSLGELREMVVSAYPRLDATRLVDKLAAGFTAAHAAGISDVEDDGA